MWASSRLEAEHNDVVSVVQVERIGIKFNQVSARWTTKLRGCDLLETQTGVRWKWDLHRPTITVQQANVFGKMVRQEDRFHGHILEQRALIAGQQFPICDEHPQRFGTFVQRLNFKRQLVQGAVNFGIFRIHCRLQNRDFT